MPNAEKRIISRTPQHTAMELMKRINALYQSSFISIDEKAVLVRLVQVNMKSGDYTDIYECAKEQCLHASSENPFWKQMKEIISEEAQT